MVRVRRIAWLVVALMFGFALPLVFEIAFAREQTHAAPAAAAAAQVKIDNLTFTPDALTVAAGAQVTWTNRDDIPHTVVSDDQTIRSKPLDTDDQFTFTFTKAGTYTYFCSLHPKMKGKVVVQ